MRNNEHCVVFDVIYVYISIGIKTQRDVLQEHRYLFATVQGGARR